MFPFPSFSDSSSSSSSSSSPVLRACECGFSVRDFGDMNEEHPYDCCTNIGLRHHINFPPVALLSDENDPSLLYYTDPYSNHGVYQPKRPWCFLGEVIEDLSFLRPGVKLKSRFNEIVAVHFYHDRDKDQFKTFSLTDLRTRGNTVAIMAPERHQFMDFSSGIRQESLDDVTVFKVTITQLLETADKIQSSLTATSPSQQKCFHCGKQPAPSVNSNFSSHPIAPPGGLSVNDNASSSSSSSSSSADSDSNSSFVPLSSCARCHLARYCNRDCQIADWKNYHKRICPQFSTIRHLLLLIRKPQKPKTAELPRGFDFLPASIALSTAKEFKAQIVGEDDDDEMDDVNGFEDGMNEEEDEDIKDEYDECGSKHYDYDDDGYDYGNGGAHENPFENENDDEEEEEEEEDTWDAHQDLFMSIVAQRQAYGISSDSDDAGPTKFKTVYSLPKRPPSYYINRKNNSSHSSKGRTVTVDHKERRKGKQEGRERIAGAGVGAGAGAGAGSFSSSSLSDAMEHDQAQPQSHSQPLRGRARNRNNRNRNRRRGIGNLGANGTVDGSENVAGGESHRQSATASSASASSASRDRGENRNRGGHRGRRQGQGQQGGRGREQGSGRGGGRGTL